jgi:hypothetical protein
MAMTEVPCIKRRYDTENTLILSKTGSGMDNEYVKEKCPFESLFNISIRIYHTKSQGDRILPGFLYDNTPSCI